MGVNSTRVSGSCSSPVSGSTPAVLDAPTVQAPELIILHGLEATRRSPYLQAMVGEAARGGWGASLLLFRSCGSRPNRTRRFYHAGETGDLGLVVERVARERPMAPLLLAGYSLGGNVLLKWLGEQGEAARPIVTRAAAISASTPASAVWTVASNAISPPVNSRESWATSWPRIYRAAVREGAAADPSRRFWRSRRRGVRAWRLPGRELESALAPHTACVNGYDSPPDV